MVYKIARMLSVVIVALLAASATFRPMSLASQISSPAYAASTNVTAPVYGWAKTWGGSASSAQAKNIVVDGSGNTYVVGEFFGTVDFDPAGSNPSATIASDKSTVDAFFSVPQQV